MGWNLEKAFNMVAHDDTSKDQMTELKEDEHKLSPEEVCTRYGTLIDPEDLFKSLGLNEAKVEDYHTNYGKNILTPTKKESLLLKFIHALFYNVFNVLLLISGALSFILFGLASDLTNIYLGSILIFVALFNAGLEFYQGYKTASLLESFLTLIPSNTSVTRDGRTRMIPAAELVPGDLVALKTGDKIPADLRLVRAVDLKVDNSSLTGESEPQERSLFMGNENHLEATNLVYNGTIIVSGEGHGIVIRIGDKTILGQIAGLTMNENKRASQLSREIDLFVKKLAAIAVLTAILFFILAMILGYGVSLTFSFAIGIFVAFVPEGLPVTVTALLTIAAKKMAKLNVLVKDLHGVETLGSITLLATDKTGTLTQNKMAVTSCWTNNQFFSFNEESDFSDGIITNKLDSSTPNYHFIMSICALCTKCRIDPEDYQKTIHERKIWGDATEVGLFRFSMEAFDVIHYSDTHKKLCEIPFSPNTKWHLTIHEMVHLNGSYVIYLKGAPERVFQKCSHILINDEAVSLDDNYLFQFNMAYERFASQGQRVLGLAQLLLPLESFPEGFNFIKDEPPNFPLEGFTFVGLISLMDPPKKGVRKAVAALKSAGIQLMMITGDHPLTAEAIARQIGLIQSETASDVAKKSLKSSFTREHECDAIVIHGDSIDTLSDREWDRIFSKREIVFARTSPRHKLMIVTRAQAKGHIVGVSGDGVNDSPALKKADLGISMNVSGSDVSKEAAVMILLDDNFSSIVHGVFQGRLLFANLKKSIKYTLTHIMPEVLSFLIFIAFGIPLPISSLLILFIDLASELAPSFSFAWEVPDSDLMLVPPRKVLCTPSMNNAIYENLTAATKSTTSLTKLSMQKTYTKTTTNFFPLLTVLEEPKKPSKIKRVYLKLKAFWNRNFYRNETGEVLVDNDLLLWSYCEAGIIISIGCFAAYLMVFYENDVPFRFIWNTSRTYFMGGAPAISSVHGSIIDASQQENILAEAQSAYFSGIIIGQWFTLFMVKHRYAYPYGKDLFVNIRSLIAIVISLAIGVFVIYTPPLNDVLLSYPVGIIPLLMPFAAGVLMIMFEFVRKFLRFQGYFGGVPKQNENLLDLIRTTTTAGI